MLGMRKTRGLDSTQEINMLKGELEMLIKERQALLRVSGAAAAFIANMDIKALPKHAYEAADLLAQMVNAIPEDTLRDSLDSVRAQVALDISDRRKKPR